VGLTGASDGALPADIDGRLVARDVRVVLDDLVDAVLLGGFCTRSYRFGRHAGATVAHAAN
jgi:hypothetical protein